LYVEWDRSCFDPYVSSREDEMGGACSKHGRDGKRIQYFGCKTPQKRPLGRPMRRWEDNIRMDVEKTGWESADWMSISNVKILEKLLSQLVCW
jgi:hypothetical protein